MNSNISGKRIRVARAMQESPMSQQDLATKCQVEGYYGIIKEVISKIERDVRGVNDIELKLLAQILNVSVLWLLKETDNPSRNTTNK